MLWDEIKEITEIINSDCDRDSSYNNPKCDTGHSYSYAPKAQYNAKILANIEMVTPELDLLAKKYHNLISHDRALTTEIQNLQLLTNNIVSYSVEMTDEVLSRLKQHFSNILNYLVHDFIENQVMSDESPANNGTTEEEIENLGYIELKKAFEHLNTQFIEVF